MKLFRHFTFDRAQLNSEERTVPVCFSSESAVDRGEFDEVLDHSTEGLDLTRLNDAHPLLLNHNPDDQIGVVERAELSPDKKGRALIRFGNSAKASEIFQDVKDGIRKHMSVGYERLRAMATETNQSGRKAIRFAWKPFELSIVPVPADPTVGVGRGKESTRTMANEECGAKCRTAWGCCNDLVGEIEDHGIGDESHNAAAMACRSAIAILVMTWEDTCYWSEATAAACVAVCQECAEVCTSAVASIRAIAACPECGAEATEAITELEEAIACCKQNAGIDGEPAATGQNSDQAAVVAEGQSGGTVVDADTRCRPETPATANRNWNLAPETRCRVDA